MKNLFIFLPFVISSVYATTFVPISIKDQIKNSDAVVKGVVVDKTYGEHEQFGIVTKVEIRKDKYFGLDPLTDFVTVYFPGGKLDNQVVEIPGSPELQVGEKTVLILNKSEDKAWVSNLGLGKYSVKKVGDEEILVNQIFPEHPKVGHMSAKRFFSLVEWVKKEKPVVRMKTKYEYDQEQNQYRKQNQGRAIASENSESSEPRSLPIYWLVIFLGISGAFFKAFKNKNS